MKQLLMFLMLCGFICQAEDSLFKRFQNPGEEAKLQAWFHWVSDFITKEGLEADLKAMGDAGIGTAHIFQAGMAHLPGEAVILSDKWFELYDVALKAAKKNNVKLGFHNCPGWSSSGGPWIKPEDSMKVVVASETDTDEKEANIKLAQPLTTHGFYRDIAVIAMPIEKPVKVKNIKGDWQADFEAFRKGEKALMLPIGKEGNKCSLVYEYAEPILPTMFVYRVDESHIWANVKLEASKDGKEWEEIRKFEVRMFNEQKTPKVCGIKSPKEKCRFYRVEFTAVKTVPWVGLKERKLVSCEFSNLPYVADIDNKNSAGVRFGFVCPWGQEQAKGIDKNACVDVSDKMDAEGNLKWVAPKDGTWRILRIGYTSTGKMCAPSNLRGLECDKLSKRGLDAHWPHMPERFLNHPGAKGTVEISIIDSYEVGGQNWTDDFAEEFKKRRGYDIKPYLPAIVGYTIGTKGETSKFLYDFQRTISDMFAENYYDYFVELCHRAGIKAALEPYGGPFDSIRAGEKCDVPTGEFWLGRPVKGSTRIASSIGHLFGQNTIAAEAFTTEAKEGRWQITPAELRLYGDKGWLEGISQLVLHSYVHQPWLNVQPGVSLGRHGTQLNRHTTWWPEMIHWSKYVRRGQELLQGGKPRSEILIFIGESNRNGGFPADALALGYNFDYANTSALHKLQNIGDKVVMPGQKPYEVFYFNKEMFPTLATLKKLKELCDGGARIASVGKPHYSPSLSDNQDEWRKLANELWDQKKIKVAKTALDALKMFGVKPYADSFGAGVRALRREIDGRDVYFVVNESEKDFDGVIDFVGMGVPELWDAVTGNSIELAVMNFGEGRTSVKMELSANGSAFVVFNPKKKANIAKHTKKPIEEPVCDLSSGWVVSDFKGKNAPEAKITLEKLISWSEAKDEKLRYFAGRAKYYKNFELGEIKDGKAYILDLGEVKEIVNVKLNGVSLGCLWNKPFKVDVTKALRKGKNALELEVVNTWPNRLIGDAIARENKVREDKQKAWPKWVLDDKADSGTGIFTWSNFFGWKADEPLLKAGLIGPVVLMLDIPPSFRYNNRLFKKGYME